MVSNMRSTGEGNEESTGSDDSAGGDGVAAEGGGVVVSFGEPVFGVPAEAVAVLDALRVLNEVDVRGLGDDALLGLFDGLEAVDRLVHGSRFGMLAELEARELTDRRLGHVTANEAGWRHGANPKRVKADVAVANTLRRHQPKLAAALGRGEVAVDRVREVCRHVNERNRHAFEGAQDSLIDLCRRQSRFSQFARDVEQLARLADADGVEPPLPRNHAKVDLHGDQLTASVELFGSQAMAFAARIEAEADRLFRLHRAEGVLSVDLPVPPRSELLAQALFNLVERGSSDRARGRLGPTADISIIVDVDQATVGDLFADGVLLPGKGASVDWSKKAMDLTGATLRYASHEWEMLTCDAEYTWVIKDAGGHPVACQHGERHASREQRRNLEFRDGRCCFPGCDLKSSWCDAHHVHHYGEGGRTEICNMALLCRRHHGVVHRRGWSMKANTAPGPGEGFFTITTPTGTVLHTQHERPPAPV